MNLHQELLHLQSRRYFLTQGKNVLGGAALASLLGRSLTTGAQAGTTLPRKRLVGPLPKVK